MCAWQIDHLAVLFEIVEVAFPVRSYGEDIHVVFLDVVDLLPFVLLDDHLIDVARLLDRLDTFHHAVPCVHLPALKIEVVSGHPHNQPITKLLCPAQQIDMPLMQYIKGTVGDDNPPVRAVAAYVGNILTHQSLSRLSGCALPRSGAPRQSEAPYVRSCRIPEASLA